MTRRLSEDDITTAGELLAAGELVVIPTETVYGLAAVADDAHAVSGIFRAKERPADNPLIVHYATLAPFFRSFLPDSKTLKHW